MKCFKIPISLRKQYLNIHNFLSIAHFDAKLDIFAEFSNTVMLSAYLCINWIFLLRNWQDEQEKAELPKIARETALDT